VASHRCNLHGDATVLASRTKDPPSYHAVGQNNASPSCFMAMFTVPNLSYNRSSPYKTHVETRGRATSTDATRLTLNALHEFR